LRAKRKEARESRQRHCKSAGQEEARELRQEEARESKQRHCKSANQEEAHELRQEEARESHHIVPGVLESVREYEGVNPHTPKATPTLGDGVPVDSRNFRERLQASKLNVSWRSLYHWKALGA